MSRKPNKPTKLKVKCPWCGRIVEFKKGRLERHIQSTNVQCVAGGQLRSFILRRIELVNQTIQEETNHES